MSLHELPRVKNMQHSAKLITYVRMGKIGFGIIKNGGIIELNDRIGNNVTSIKSLLKKNEQKQT